MNLDLTPEHELVRQTVREFALDRIAPVAEELDRERRFPYELVAELAELGLMGMTIPEEYGGGGTDTLSYAIAIEELTRIDSSVAITVAAHHSLGTLPIYLFGTEEQRRRWLPELAAGRKLAAFGLTEPDAGSDAGAARTTAELRDGRWIVNGSKIFITNAGTDITACVIDHGEDGRGRDLEPRDPERHPGLRDLGADAQAGLARVRHARAVLPRRRRPRGPPARAGAARGSGSSCRSSTAAGSRSPRWASGSRRARTTSLWRMRGSGRQFGRPISTFQAVQFRLADMAVEIEAGRGLVYRAAWLKDQGRDFAQAAAMAKLYTGELAHRVASESLQIHGGYGFMDEYRDLAPVSRPEDPGDRRGHERRAAHGDRQAPRLNRRQSGPGYAWAMTISGGIAFPRSR